MRYFIVHVVLDGVEVEVVISDANATVADLAEAAQVPRRALVIDGQLVEPPTPLAGAGLREGSLVVTSDTAAERPTANRPGGPPVAALHVVGGLDAGRSVRLPAGSSVIGRRPPETDGVLIDDGTVSRRHAALSTSPDGTATIRDLGSSNGTWLDGALATRPIALTAAGRCRLGATLLRVTPLAEVGGERTRPAVAIAARWPSGRAPFHRPPRQPVPPPSSPLRAPRPMAPAAQPAPVNVVAVVAPLVAGAAMVVLLGNPTFALFAALGPVVLVGNAWENRHRAQRANRREAARFDRELASFAADGAEASSQERARRERRHPDLAELVERATAPKPELWERRRDDPDFLILRLGRADLTWEPPVEGSVSPETAAALRAVTLLRDAPVVLDLGGAVLGVAGAREAALACARALVCQAATLHGPADLAVAIATSEAHVPVWEWAKSLPHVWGREPGRPLLAAGLGPARALADRVGRLGRSAVVVIDGPDLALRPSEGRVTVLVLADAVERLPSLCTAVIELEGIDGAANLRPVGSAGAPLSFVADGIAATAASDAARALARFDDPEIKTTDGLSAAVALLPLLSLVPNEVGKIEPDALLACWALAEPAALATPVGSTGDGTFVLDLVADGPHALVAGTTGSGKSELLRTLVAGLASRAAPDAVTFVLVDFKGGSAFDECARLPHVVGLVTDLDPLVAERALRCLEAELRHRERVLRAAGVVDLTDYAAARALATATPPLPRLVVVVDEFATLRAELPGFVDSLVGIAQRGRSLGMHLVLATQRPSGAVSDTIRANTNIRIALRVQDDADSLDLIGKPDAARLPRLFPGRALARLGPSEVTGFQAALVTTRSEDRSRPPVEIRPFTFPIGGEVATPRATTGDSRTTDLRALVDAAIGAFASTGAPPPRPVWPDPLPSEVDLASVVAGAPEGVVPFLLVDDPDRQWQGPGGWCPADGNLLLFGSVGSGTTTALASVALALATMRTPDDAHLYVVDHAAGDLLPLVALPHTGAVVTAGDRERLERLVRMLGEEMARRRAAHAGNRADFPLVAVLVDGLSGLVAGARDVAGLAIVDDLARIAAEGPDVGIVFAASAERPGAVPPAFAALARTRLLFRLADPADHGALGVPAREIGDLRPGRALQLPDRRFVQVARPATSLAEAVTIVAAGAPPRQRRAPAPVGALPARVSLAPLLRAPTGSGRPWRLPVGIGERDLGPACILLHPGEHMLVAGPPRSGKSAALRSIATSFRWSVGAGTVVPLGEAPPRGPALVIIDDADTVEDEHGVVRALLAGEVPDVHVVAAVRSDSCRALFDHWTRELRRSRLGLLLQPDLDLDGDLLGVRLPRRSPVAMMPGRGYLVSGGEATLVHLASDTP